MSSVNYYLKKKEESTGKSLIYLQFKYSGQKLVYSFGQTIDPSHWNDKKQRVKSNKETTADGKHSLNDLLDNLEEVCLTAYNNELKTGFPLPATIKQHLIAFMNQNHKGEDKPTLYKLIDRFTAGEIKHEGKNKSSGTLRLYKVVLGRLKDFETHSRYPIDFDTINLDFFYKFISYLKTTRESTGRTKKKKPLAQNSIAKTIQVLITFMNEAVELGYTNNLQFRSKKFYVSWEESDSVYLTENEINTLFKHDFSKNKRLEQVRDLFVFGCYVGLRFSDYSDVKPENIIMYEGEKFIKMRTRKTGEVVVIPCSPIVLQIFDKYAENKNGLPPAISNQKFNDYIKEACEEAKLNEKGRLLSEPEKELWECVSSHTARRSFATNLYLGGFPTLEIMKITGHKTEKAFLGYIKTSKLDAAKRLSKHMQMKWNEKLLKVV